LPQLLVEDCSRAELAEPSCSRVATTTGAAPGVGRAASLSSVGWPREAGNQPGGDRVELAGVPELEAEQE
jgi:hypothetical protein